MKIDYQVKVEKLSKYIGNEPDENFAYNEVKEENYTYIFSKHSEALKEYKMQCLSSAEQVCMPICFTHQHRITLLDNEIDGKRKILFQFNCSSI
jgi:hypothetical protein